MDVKIKFEIKMIFLELLSSESGLKIDLKRFRSYRRSKVDPILGIEKICPKFDKEIKHFLEKSRNKLRGLPQFFSISPILCLLLDPHLSQ